MTTTEQNRATIRAFHHRLWGEADLTAIEDVIHPDAVTHWGDFESNTVDAVREDVERYYKGFTGVETAIGDLLADGDKVVLRWSTWGDHTGPYGSVPATGKRILMEGVDVYRLDGGRIVEAWSMWDGLAVYQQLGLVAEDVGP